MTIQTQVSVQSEVYTFRPRDYDVFAGLDVDKHSIAATFTDHDRLLQSLRLSYSAAQLLNYVRKHFPGQRLAFVYEAGPTGFGLYDELMAAGHPCLVVAPPMVPRAPGARVKTNRLDSRKLSDCVARRRTKKHPCAIGKVSRAASSGATARHSGAAVDCDQMSHQGTAAL